ncbi:uncharacterized protein A4U43_C08F21910 [Asparagus officinalis]|nr:uncharacterized protein A4U43_C08F21910 [Asparagus officinalis]
MVGGARDIPDKVWKEKGGDAAEVNSPTQKRVATQPLSKMSFPQKVAKVEASVILAQETPWAKSIDVVIIDDESLAQDKWTEIVAVETEKVKARIETEAPFTASVESTRRSGMEPVVEEVPPT